MKIYHHIKSPNQLQFKFQCLYNYLKTRGFDKILVPLRPIFKVSADFVFFKTYYYLIMLI